MGSRPKVAHRTTGPLFQTRSRSPVPSGLVVVHSRFVLNFRDPRSCKRRQVFCRTQREAIAKRDNLLAAIATNSYSASRVTLTVANAVEHWLDNRRGEVKASTCRPTGESPAPASSGRCSSARRPSDYPHRPKRQRPERSSGICAILFRAYNSGMAKKTTLDDVMKSSTATRPRSERSRTYTTNATGNSCPAGRS